MPHSGASIPDDRTDTVQRIHIRRRNLINLAVLLLLLYVLIPQISTFHNSLSVARKASGWWLLYGLAIALTTYLSAALTYRLLALKRLRYVRTVVVEVASSFIDRLLPVGIGGMSVNYANLRHQNHTPAEAGVVVAANTVLGVIGLMFPVALAALLNHTVVSQLHFKKLGTEEYWAIAAIGVAVVLALIVSRKVRGWALRIIKNVHASLSAYRHHPWRLGAALLSSMSLTVLYTLSLLACTRATGLYISFPHALLVMALGGVGGAIAPTPGGLIGVEAGLVAGLVAYGASNPEALAATLVFRLVTYWFMLVLGAAVFGLIRHREYI